MSKKILLPVIAALLLALAAGVWIYADAAAQGRLPQRKLPRLIGQVTAISDDQITIQTRAGQEREIRIDETTRFIDPQKQQLSLEDLQTGGWVAVVVARGGGEPPLARLVVIMPEDFDPANWAGIRGRVAGVDVAGNAFTLEHKGGQSTTASVDANTKYLGQVTGLADLQVGMLAQAATEEQANGDLLAKTLRAGYPLVKHAGEVISVDPAAGQSFTVQTRQGETITFQVSDETHFRSRGGLVDGLDDLKPGMPVAVGANDLGDGQYQALTVLVALRRIR